MLQEMSSVLVKFDMGEVDQLVGPMPSYDEQ
jgi:hypothetical protein